MSLEMNPEQTTITNNKSYSPDVGPYEGISFDAAAQEARYENPYAQTLEETYESALSLSDWMQTKEKTIETKFRIKYENDSIVIKECIVTNSQWPGYYLDDNALRAKQFYFDSAKEAVLDYYKKSSRRIQTMRENLFKELCFMTKILETLFEEEV